MRAADNPDYYALLQVAPTASQADLRAAHKRLLRQVHPDVNPDADPSQAARINAAFEVLSDPDKRRAYDARRRPSARSSAHHPDPSVRDARREAEELAARHAAHMARTSSGPRETEAERTARREGIARDKAAAAERLAAERERLRVTAAARQQEQAARKGAAETARQTADELKAVRDARLKQRAHAASGAGGSSPALDAFRTLLWKTMRDPVFLHEIPPPRREGVGKWQLTSRGVQWVPSNGLPLALAATDIDWAVRQLWRTGRLSQFSMEEHFARRGSEGEGRALGRALFTLLRRMPFFEVRPEPTWALLFNRQPWEPYPKSQSWERSR